ncbi:MAG TPA: protein phosphatase 2C domain-containing protein [bacterium]|nr:protein phosphatase 2C domain-containing protein [bacterium]
MPATPFVHLQSFLTEVSRLPAPDQISLVQSANLALEGRGPQEDLLALRDAAQSVLRKISGDTALPPQSILWTRWSESGQDTGVGLLCTTPHGRLVLLPEGFDADRLSFDQPVDDPITLGALAALCPEHASLFPPSPARNERRSLRNAAGREAGWDHVVCGGAEGTVSDAASMLSGVTSLGDGVNQEDGLYLARFRTGDGRTVRILAGADGLGGAALGEEASKAALLGVQAGVIRALAENRIPLAGDLFEDARTALVDRVNALESARERPFQKNAEPNTVIAIAVLVDDLATVATAGDFLVTYSFRDESGNVVTAGCSEVDAYSDHGVYSTLLEGPVRLCQVRMRPGSWLCLGSDGLFGSLMQGFKTRFSSFLRYEGGTPRPEQRLLHNLNHILRHTPPAGVAQALFDSSMGRSEIPGLGPITCEFDNKTALASHWGEDISRDPFLAPGHYADLNRVFPGDQYVYDSRIFRVQMTPALSEISIGRSPHPGGLPMMVLPDEKLEPLHARIVREGGNPEVLFFVEKLVGRGRIVLFDKHDNKIAAILRKGSRHPVRPGDLIRLTHKTFLRFNGI